MLDRLRGQRVIPGNSVTYTGLGVTPSRWEVSRTYGLQGLLVAGMHQPPGLRYGHAGSWEMTEGGPAQGFDGTPNPLFRTQVLQLFTGAEAFRLGATRAAERRDYSGEIEAVAFRPFGAM
jgi:hypothetical protein